MQAQTQPQVLTRAYRQDQVFNEVLKKRVKTTKHIAHQLKALNKVFEEEDKGKGFRKKPEKNYQENNLRKVQKKKEN